MYFLAQFWITLEIVLLYQTASQPEKVRVQTLILKYYWYKIQNYITCTCNTHIKWMISRYYYDYEGYFWRFNFAERVRGCFHWTILRTHNCHIGENLLDKWTLQLWGGSNNKPKDFIHFSHFHAITLYTMSATNCEEGISVRLLSFPVLTEQ